MVRLAGRYGLSVQERNEVWRRWQAGQLITDIGRAFGRNICTIRDLLRSEGGITPAPRRRSKQALSRAEREEISRGPGSSLPRSSA